MTDECTEDWTLLSANADAGAFVFEVERAFDTGDTQDHIIADDSFEGELAGRSEALHRKQILGNRGG